MNKYVHIGLWVVGIGVLLYGLYWLWENFGPANNPSAVTATTGPSVSLDNGTAMLSVGGFSASADMFGGQSN